MIGSSLRILGAGLCFAIVIPSLAGCVKTESRLDAEDEAGARAANILRELRDLASEASTGDGLRSAIRDPTRFDVADEIETWTTEQLEDPNSDVTAAVYKTRITAETVTVWAYVTGTGGASGLSGATNVYSCFTVRLVPGSGRGRTATTQCPDGLAYADGQEIEIPLDR